MDSGEAGRVAMAIGVLTDWLARAAERIEKLETRVAEHERELADIEQRHANEDEIVSTSTKGD